MQERCALCSAGAGPGRQRAGHRGEPLLLVAIIYVTPTASPRDDAVRPDLGPDAVWPDSLLWHAEVPHSLSLCDASWLGNKRLLGGELGKRVLTRIDIVPALTACTCALTSRSLAEQALHPCIACTEMEVSMALQRELLHALEHSDATAKVWDELQPLGLHACAPFFHRLVCGGAGEGTCTPMIYCVTTWLQQRERAEQERRIYTHRRPAHQAGQHHPMIYCTVRWVPCNMLLVCSPAAPHRVEPSAPHTGAYACRPTSHRTFCRGRVSTQHPDVCPPPRTSNIGRFGRIVTTSKRPSASLKKKGRLCRHHSVRPLRSSSAAYCSTHARLLCPICHGRRIHAPGTSKTVHRLAC